MKAGSVIAVVLLSALTALAVVKATVPDAQGAQETAFHHVMRTQTIRCGYIISPPFFALDPQNGGQVRHCL